MKKGFASDSSIKIYHPPTYTTFNYNCERAFYAMGKRRNIIFYGYNLV